MARCEDYPCCGHELGCCPDYDGSGRQLNMVCVCGAKLPIDNRSSICDSCLRDPDDPYDDEGYFDDEEDEEDEECRQDQMLERQELEDFENHYGADEGWNIDW